MAQPLSPIGTESSQMPTPKLVAGSTHSQGRGFQVRPAWRVELNFSRS